MRSFRPFAGFPLLPVLILLAAEMAAQPAHLVKDIDDTPRHGGVWIQEMAAFGPSAYFGASSQSSYEQLWRSEMSEAGGGGAS
jgi:hypothetical protein